jgi:hypothetical protein
MTPAVVALLADRAAEPGLAAAFEEEGVPLRCEEAAGGRFWLAREAARRSPLGLGIGADAEGFALALAASPGRAYLEAPPERARAFGHAAARVAAQRPLNAATDRFA